MENEKKRFNEKQKKSLLKTFLIAAGVTLGLCIIILVAGMIFYNTTIGGQSKSQVKNLELTEEEKVFEEEKNKIGDINKTIAVFGVDEDEVRTDVIIVVNLNTTTNKVKCVSIPRDTKVIWTDKQQRALMELTGNSRSISKINEMAAYGRINENIGNIRDFTIDEIENILKVKVDNYVTINLEAFRAIVDAVGGVEVNVPQRMDYDDSHQDLHIHLDPGLQLLDGDAAEGLVRFRRYKLGDEQRVAVQQTFLAALAEKVLSPEMANKLPSIITSVFPYVKTDVKLNEILGYLELLEEFNPSDIKFYTVPGYGDDSEGPSYYYIDDVKLQDMINEVFYDDGKEDETLDGEESEETVIDKTVSIEVYNAAGIKGVATNCKNALEEAGYSVAIYDNYEQTGLEESTIYAKELKQGKQFLDYVQNADIVVKTDQASDIVLVIGKESVIEE